MSTTTNQSTKIDRTDRELVDSLRRFPRGVIPVAVLREIISRGPAIEDELLRPLRAAVADAGKGVGSISSECFFCFGLLLANPNVRQLPVIEDLLRLSSDDVDKAIGELKHDGFTALLVSMVQTADRDKVIAWIDRVVLDDSINVWSRWACLHALNYLVRENLMDRSDAIDRIVSVLQQQSSEKHDLLSAACVTGLSNLQAVEVESFIVECFDRNQIDESVFARSDWDAERDENLTPEQKLGELLELKFDIVEIVESWHAFQHVSHSLDPQDETYEFNPMAHPGWVSAGLSEQEIERHLSAIRASHDGSFPRESVKALSHYTKQVKQLLIAEVRAGLDRAGGPDARASKAPFLALTLLIARNTQLPRELLLAIVDLPKDQRMDLFGDSMFSAIVNALSLSLRAETGPIDSRIADPERGDIDRSQLVNFYVESALYGFLSRTEAIQCLAELLQQTRGQSLLLTASLIEGLCLMSAVEHRSSIEEALETVSGFSRFSDAELLGMLNDPEKAMDPIKKDLKGRGDVMGQIEKSVMFDRDALRSSKSPPKPNIIQTDLIGRSSPFAKPMIRNQSPATGRNSPCPCGSGKKYKKCCLRQ